MRSNLVHHHLNSMKQMNQDLLLKMNDSPLVEPVF